ncbi:MAG: hypothetical protein L6Q57_00050 [Alphaproteobacteria bacterium]|nr:hypothetical protein [Alphaproteobacteria bacterium]
MTQGEQSGNVFFIILLAVALLGLLSAALMQGSDSGTSNIDDETLSIRASEFQRHAGEFERAVAALLQNGVSESDLRFSHADAPSEYADAGAADSQQVFHSAGGAATYRDPPDSINDGSTWEFYGGTHIPGVGTSKADLVAVLPNVTDQFCAKINAMNGQDAPQDTGGSIGSGASPGNCVYTGTDGRFGATHQFFDPPNTMSEASFTQDANLSAPQAALEACVVCAADNNNYAYHVLLAR